MNIHRPLRRPTRWARRPHRGVAVLVVLLLLSVTLALSYASVRSQYTAALIHENAMRRGSARHAAMVGMAMAIKNMNRTDWVGVDNAIAGTLNGLEGYSAAFTTGDATLGEDDPNCADYPYRVTVLSTGYAIDSANPARSSQYQIEAVLQLIPRALSDEPDGFGPDDEDRITAYALCQWKAGKAKLNVPMQVDGPVRLRDELELCDELSWGPEARERYLEDLRKAAEDGGPDYRPMTDSITYPFDDQSSTTRSLVRSSLGVTERDGSSAAEFDWPDYDLTDSYQLYPGGKSYTPETLSGTLEDEQLGPDPISNPLGIFVRRGEVRIRADVTVEGTLLTDGGFWCDVNIEGDGVELLAYDLPSLYGEDAAVRLPTVISADDIRLNLGAGVTATGLLIAGDDFKVNGAKQDEIQLTLSGTAAGKDIEFPQREDWDEGPAWWAHRYSEFLGQLGGTDPIESWPQWLEEERDLMREPQIVIRAESDSHRYHWYKPQEPLFVGGDHDGDGNDDGLRWNLIRWTENP